MLFRGRLLGLVMFVVALILMALLVILRLLYVHKI